MSKSKQATLLDDIEAAIKDEGCEVERKRESWGHEEYLVNGAPVSYSIGEVHRDSWGRLVEKGGKIRFTLHGVYDRGSVRPRRTWKEGKKPLDPRKIAKVIIDYAAAQARVDTNTKARDEKYHEALEAYARLKTDFPDVIQHLFADSSGLCLRGIVTEEQARGVLAELHCPEIETEELFIAKDMLEEIKQEAARLDRSVSWVIRRGLEEYITKGKTK